jgi:hypothetical protein
MTSLRRISQILASVLTVSLLTGLAPPDATTPGTPQYDRDGALLFPDDYRDWVFLSSGLNMSYSADPAAADADMFDNTFAPRTAYAAFLRTGAWPDRTVLILENRGGAAKGSINRSGRFQTGQAMGVEAHVKDVARFAGGWGFFAFEGAKPARRIDYAAACYACHQAHAAADTTFVQFYPTLLPAAARLKTLSAAYLAESAGAEDRARP